MKGVVFLSKLSAHVKEQARSCSIEICTPNTRFGPDSISTDPRHRQDMGVQSGNNPPFILFILSIVLALFGAIAFVNPYGWGLGLGVIGILLGVLGAVAAWFRHKIMLLIFFICCGIFTILIIIGFIINIVHSDARMWILILIWGILNFLLVVSGTSFNIKNDIGQGGCTYYGYLVWKGVEDCPSSPSSSNV
ncbi:hypothetical protein PROFUN_02525 [Planoprotostelium fungivorum]|uniref:DUF4203 domain-containing protein n=1 Tax=Planoprotostelium fungivorum TaxID=1890364 RepID=A0A2P6MPB4_9EUKA|nr:hypothetical protein PROFUN_02525 [Planoprotostelium fungivorum]